MSATRASTLSRANAATSRPSVRRTVKGAQLLALAAILIVIPLLLTGRVRGLPRGWLFGLSLLDLNFALITLVAALALQVLIGRAGLISIGSAGFYALGAGLGGLFGNQLKFPFLLVLVLSILVGAVIGAVVGLPSMKLKGLYAVLATLAFHFIAVYLFLAYEAKYFSSTGVLYPGASVAGFELQGDIRWYIFLVVVVALVFAGAVNLTKGRVGVALLAVRDQELAARMSAVDVGRTKVAVYAITSGITTLAGTLYVYYLSTATVELFQLTVAIQLIAIIVIGGMARPSGAVVGVVVWMLLPKIIDTASEQFVSGRGGSTWLGNNIDGINSAIFGAAIVLILVLRPSGLTELWQALASRVNVDPRSRGKGGAR